MSGTRDPLRLFGVDVGGSSVKFGAVLAGARPEILERGAFDGHDRRPPDEALADLASRLIAMAARVGWERPDGVGLGVPGLVHRERGVLVAAPNLAGWAGLPVATRLGRLVPWPVRLDNDANAFALAEWLWGAGAGCRDAVFLTLGTGIGGGVVAGGRMVRGVPGFASEPGHTILQRDGIPCPCGSRGCAERYVGIEAVARLVRANPALRGDPRFAGPAESIPIELFEAVESGNRAARAVWDEVGEALGTLLVNLVNLLNPERIIIGGGIGQAGEHVLGPARRVLFDRSVVARHAPPEVVPAALGAAAGLLGAAGLFVEPGARPGA